MNNEKPSPTKTDIKKHLESTIIPNEKQKTFDFEYYSKALPLMAVLLIFFGVSSEMLYYDHFNIEIQYFLEPSEIFLLFFSNIIALVIMIVVVFFIVIFTEKAEVSIESIDNNFEFRLKDYFKHFGMPGLLFALILVLFGVCNSYIDIVKNHFNMPSKMIYYLAAFIGLASIGVYLGLEAFKFLNKRQSTYTFKHYIGIAVVIIFIGTVNITKLFHAEDVENRKLYAGTIILMKDSTSYVSNDSIYYIGKTKNYCFIHNEKKDATRALPMDEIRWIEVKEKTLIELSEIKW